jgi:hypothetical protein
MRYATKMEPREIDGRSIVIVVRYLVEVPRPPRKGSGKRKCNRACRPCRYRGK